MNAPSAERTKTAFAVLAEPHRRDILDLLRDGERLAGDLGSQLALTQPTVSKHLKVLREAGLVEVRRDAQRRWYRLRAEPLRHIDSWLAPYRRFWGDMLDALEDHLDEMPDDAATRDNAGLSGNRTAGVRRAYPGRP